MLLQRTARMLVFALAAWLSCATPAVAAAPSGAETIVHMLDYVGVDYAATVNDRKVTNQTEYQEQREFAERVEVSIGKLPPHALRDSLQADARTLRALIETKAPGDEIVKLTAAMRTRLIQAYDIAIAPRTAPDLTAAAGLFASQCAACHGARGRGDGPAAKGLDPAPSNFHAVERFHNRSLYSLYSTITLGVAGTPMQPFVALSDEQRWALAFFVGGLRSDEKTLARGAALWRQKTGRDRFASLQDIATVTEKEIADSHGDDGAAVLEWLTRNPSELAHSEPPLAFTRRVLARSVETYRNGDREAAQKQAVTAYLEGFELVEASLDTVDHALREQIEAQMIRLRGLMRDAAPVTDVAREADLIHAALDHAQQRLDEGQISPAATAFSAFIILLREGLEALLVVATIVAFLARAGRRDAMRYIHFGWVSALLLGVATWFVASFLIGISGASREMTEGVAALFSAAILIYVGFWLHSKAYAQRWREFIETHLKGALSKGTLWALASVSFVAVYRELFETVLFYEALWAQSGSAGAPAIIGGFGAAVLALGLIAWLIFRFGMRLPIGPFFAVSSTVLALLAVIFVGQGVAALQEAGKIDAHVLEFPKIPMLGIYPTWQSLAAQFATFVIVVAGFFYGFLASRRASPAL